MDVSEGLRYGNFISNFSSEMIRESFIFYSSFLQWLDTIQDDSERLKAYEYISHYSLKWEEPEPNNWIAYTVFLLIKPQIDANNKRYLDGCKWWRKPKEKTSGSENKKPVVSKKTKIKKPNENDNDNENDNEKENVLTLSKDNEEEKSSFGNVEINECLEIIKSFNWGLIDWTQKWNRIYWKNLIWKLKQAPPVMNWDYTWQDTLKAILQVISQNKYHRSKITNPKTIYDNLTLLFQVCKEEWQQKIPEIPTL